MATSIDCRAYYIDNQHHVIEKSRQVLSQNLNNNNNNNNNSDAGTGFSVAKYLIEKPVTTGIERNSSANLFHVDHACVVDNLTDGERNGAAAEIATGNDVRTSGHAQRARSVRGRLRGVVCRLETLLRDMKVVLYYFRR